MARWVSDEDQEERKRYAYMVKEGLIKPKAAAEELGMNIRQFQRVLAYYEIKVPPTPRAAKDNYYENRKLHKLATISQVPTHHNLKLLAEESGYGLRTLHRWKQDLKSGRMTLEGKFLWPLGEDKP